MTNTPADYLGIALGWLGAAFVLPWFYLAHGVLRACEKVNGMKSWGLGALVAVGPKCDLCGKEAIYSDGAGLNLCGGHQ